MVFIKIKMGIYQNKKTGIYNLNSAKIKMVVIKIKIGIYQNKKWVFIKIKNGAPKAHHRILLTKIKSNNLYTVILQPS
jgi:hypothetical protein